MKRLSLKIFCAVAFFAIGLTVYFQITSSQYNSINRVEAAHADNVADIATVSFGAWRTSPPLDRFPNQSPTRTANQHVVLPKTVTIKAGGAVNFVIAGLHQVIVYEKGIFSSIIEPHTFGIDTSQLVTPTGPGGLPPLLIDDPKDRIYRGPDPSLLPADRVEVVHFDKPGLYLVICGVNPHFQNGMFGFVRVVRNNNRSVHEHE